MPVPTSQRPTSAGRVAAAEASGGVAGPERWAAPAGPLGPVRLEEVASLDAIAPEWRALASANPAGVPFHTPEWATAWWARFQERRALLHDRPLFHAFRAPSGTLVGVAPLMVTRRPAVGALVRVVDAIGADPNVTELRGLVCHPDWEERAIGALLERLHERRAEWDLVHLRGLPAGGGAHRLLEARPGVEWGQEVPAYTLPLPATWEELRRDVSRNLRESLRHGYNSLKRDGITFEFTVAREAAEVRAALQVFFELHGARAGLAGTVSHGNVFASATAREFLEDVCERLSRRDMVRVFQLRVAGQVVATRVAFAMGDTLYLYFSGYRPDWSRYGVMTTTVAETIRHAIEHGFRRVHLSMGTDVSKLRWRPEQAVYRHARLVSPTRRGRLVHRLISAAHARGSSHLLQRLLGREFHGS